MDKLFELLNKLGSSQHYDKVLLSTEQLADLTGNKKSTLITWRCTKTVQIPYIKIGKTVRYRLSDVLSWLKKNEVGTDPQMIVL